MIALPSKSLEHRLTESPLLKRGGFFAVRAALHRVINRPKGFLVEQASRALQARTRQQPAANHLLHVLAHL